MGFQILGKILEIHSLRFLKNREVYILLNESNKKRDTKTLEILRVELLNFA